MPQKIPLLKVKDNEGNSVPVPALQGPPGGVDSVCGHQGDVDLTVSGALELDKTNANMALSHKEAAGYRHLPAGGSAGQILRGAGDGSGEWVDFTAGENYVAGNDYAFPLAAGTTTGTGAAYSLTLDPPLTAYTPGMMLCVNFHTAGYTSASLNINGLGAKILYALGGTFSADIPAGLHILQYDGDFWRIVDLSFLRLTGGNLHGHMNPAANGLYDLGSSSSNWRYVRAQAGQFSEQLEIGGSPVADFVVEQGISGYWTYRKWNSGTAEAWFRNTYTSLTFSNDVGSNSLFQYARYNLDLALPISVTVFKESPRMVMVTANRGTETYPFGGFCNARSSTTVDVVLWSAIGGALPNVSVELYAVGSWK